MKKAIDVKREAKNAGIRKTSRTTRKEDLLKPNVHNEAEIFCQLNSIELKECEEIVPVKYHLFRSGKKLCGFIKDSTNIEMILGAKEKI